MTENLPAIANQAQWFLVWRGLGGDSKLAGRALGVSPRILDAMAHDFQWEAMAGGSLGLKDEAVEKKVNRVLSYQQGKRLIQIIEGALDHIEQNPERLQKALFRPDEDGHTLILESSLFAPSYITESRSDFGLRTPLAIKEEAA